MKFGTIMIAGMAVAGIALLIREAAAKSVSDSVQPLTPILSGTYAGYGNIYSPEISGDMMYFSGWFNNSDYPNDAIYSVPLNNLDPTNVNKVIQISGMQVGDPSIVGGSMYMTYAPNSSDVIQNGIARSTLIGGSWSVPQVVINRAWLPAAVGTDSLYVYYTYADTVSVALMRAKMTGDTIVATDNTVFDSPYPINVDVKYANGLYYLIGDYWYNNVYSIGLWTSVDGLNFTAYNKNPIIMPDGDNIIARTPNFSISGNALKIYFAQQKLDWWTNAIYFKDYTIS